MDAHGNRKNLIDVNTYRLVNKATGKVEAEGLKRVAAMDLQNRLWSQKIKTTVEIEA